MMPRPHVLAAAFSLAVIVGTVQSSEPRNNLPKDVVDQFCKMDAAGERLTSGGWQRANAFFVRPSPPVEDAVVGVMGGDFFEGTPQIKGDEAIVGIEYLKLGQLDSAMRFVWAASPSSPVKIRAFYTLVLTERHWELRSDGSSPREVTGPKEWRIKDFQSESVVTVDAAIRYVIETRDKSTDPNLKRNADATLAILNKFEKTPPRPST
jgi:hypothetical protein